MIAPLSWLKEYVDITLPPKQLGDRLTEVGLGTEKIEKKDNDTIFELEITPNRPDLLSIIGVAREVATIEGKKIKYPHLRQDFGGQAKLKTILPLKIHPNFNITPRLTGIIINNVNVKESPRWLRDRLENVGMRSINNIVDITNFVMKELGNPIHSFDYYKIEGNEMWIKQAEGGESFESVDEITYHLPKGAIIFTDAKKVFDLVGIKGGKNSGTYEDTKTVFIAVEVDDPVLIRRASQALALRSDASAIFERNVNKGGTVDALKRTVDLILELAGGEIASELIDLKEQEFKPWKLTLRLDRLEFLLGIKIPNKEVVAILDNLNLTPKLKGNAVEVMVPTYRNDLQIEEDLVEEVARIYGYNKFPKTLPIGQIPTNQIPYFSDFRLDEKVGLFLTGCGFSEVYTYSLISEKDVEENGFNPDHVLRVDNPVSREYEYLRPNLKSNLIKALRQNKSYFPEVNLYEIGRVYLGKNVEAAKEEYHLAGISNKKDFAQIKGMLETLFARLGVNDDPTDAIEVIDEGVYFEINYSELIEKARPQKIFDPLPKYPPIIEDLSIISDAKTGELLQEIKKQSPLISEVSLLDQYGESRTFHIVYQHKEKNLTTEEVGEIRAKILKALKEKFNARLKE